MRKIIIDNFSTLSDSSAVKIAAGIIKFDNVEESKEIALSHGIKLAVHENEITRCLSFKFTDVEETIHGAEGIKRTGI